jgi:hypothetical protein
MPLHAQGIRLYIEPQWLDSIGIDPTNNCRKFRQTGLDDHDSLPLAMALKFHIRYFSDSTEKAYAYQMAHGVDGMLDTLVGMRIGLEQLDGTTTWFAQDHWEAKRIQCIDVVNEKPIRYKHYHVEYGDGGNDDGYGDLRDLRFDLNHYRNMPITVTTIEKHDWFRIPLFPRTTDTLPIEGRLVVELNFASGKQLIGYEE